MHYTTICTKHLTKTTTRYKCLLKAHSGKMWSPLDDRYLSALIAQRLARSLRKRKVLGSNPTVGKNFSFCNSRLALIIVHRIRIYVCLLITINETSMTSFMQFQLKL